MNAFRFPADVATQGAVSTASRFNDYSRQTAEDLGLDFLDLTNVIQDSWVREGQRHKWEIDSHWNKKATRWWRELLISDWRNG